MLLSLYIACINIPSAGVITASWQSVAKQADAPVRR